MNDKLISMLFRLLKMNKMHIKKKSLSVSDIKLHPFQMSCESKGIQ